MLIDRIAVCPVADVGDRVGPTPSDSQHELTAFEHFAPPVAQNKVANNPRLNAVCTRIVDQLEEHYAMPTSTPAYDAGDGAPNQRSETLQLAALDQARNTTAPTSVSWSDAAPSRTSSPTSAST
jgi:hypothetical protein